jgi:zinc transporter 1
MAELDVASDIHSHDHSHGHSHGPTIGQADHLEHRHNHKSGTKKHDHNHDFGMMGVLLHVASDAINNIGVIIAGLIIWKTDAPGRYYADPAVSMAISLMILFSSLPLVKKTGHILLQSPPLGLDVNDIRHDLEKIPNVESVHELHVWRLNQTKSLASAHVVVPSNTSVEQFQGVAKTINECLHAYGVHSVTLQPEVELRRRPIAGMSRNVSEDGAGVVYSADGMSIPGTPGIAEDGISIAANDEPRDSEDRRRRCLMNCGTGCEKMTCCG